MKLTKVAQYLSNKLLLEGFILHRYNAFSTNSIYIKLDWGAMNSIRISDHEGYEHLKYKYNVISGLCGSYWTKDDGKWRYYCGTSKEQLDRLLELILNDRVNIKSYGNYDNLVESYRNNRRTDISFWKNAKEVMSIEYPGVTDPDN